MEERAFHPLDYVSVLQRRKLWFIVPLVVCLIGGAIAAVVWPREYISEAEIGVAAPQLRPELLAGVSSLNAEERARAVSQQLLSPAVLERVAREEQIHPDWPAERTTQWMRSKIEKTIYVPPPVAKTNGNPTLDRFKLGWTDDSPERAQQIANRVATVFVEENSKVRTAQAQNTSEVLAQQVSDSQRKLATLEDELRKRKETYMGRLPEQMNSNLSLVNGLRQQLESNATQQRAETDRLNLIESQLDMMRQGIGAVGTSGATPSPIAADVSLAHSRVTELQKRLSDARAMGYTDQHPEVIIAKEELTKAQSDLAAARKAQRSPNRDELLNTDPFYAAKLNEARFAKNRLNSLRTQADRIEAQIASFQSRVESAPVVEQQLASLTQQRDLEKANYESLVKRHQDSVMAEDLARKQGGERFSILYPAYLGRQISPDMLKLWAIAIGLGLVLGAAAVVGREFLDRSVHDARALQTEFEIPVLGEIPRIPA